MSRKRRRKRPKTRPNQPEVSPKRSRPSSLNKWGAVVAIGGLAGLFALVLVLGEGPDPNTLRADDPVEDPIDPVEAWQQSPVVSIPIDARRDFSQGPEDAAVTIVEFSDFECPYCARAVYQLQEVLDAYPDDVRLVFKNFPLDSSCNEEIAEQLHPMACHMAVVARCAGAQSPEMFWTAHDALFEIRELREQRVAALPEAIGADAEAFSTCLEDDDELREVLNDVALGNSLEITATPTVFVNGRVSPSYGAEELGAIIEHILDNE